MDNKTHVLNSIVKLITDNGITANDLQSIIKDAEKQDNNGKQSNLMRALAYLGGMFMFAGICIFIAMNWDGMNSAARIVITLGSGIATFIMAMVAHRDQRFHKAAIPLFLLSAFLQGSGILVAGYELNMDHNWRYVVLVMTGTLSIQYMLSFWTLRTSTLVFLTLFFATFFTGTVLDLLKIDEELIALTLGAAVVLTCIGIDKTEHRVITPVWYLLGSTGFLCGAFELLENSAIEIIYLGITTGIVYLSTIVRSRILLFVGTVATLAYIGYFTSQHFVDSFGWPLALVALGMVMIALSAFAIRINKHYIRDSAA